MGSQGFSFPPPPPPPPAAQQPAAYPPATHGQNSGGRGGGQRGRGRGQGHRGRGGHSDGGRAPSYPPPGGFNYQQSNYGGYPSQPVHNAPYMPQAPYAQAQGQTQGYPIPQNTSTYPNPQFPQPVASAGYQHLPYNTPANHAAPYPPTPTYMHGLPAPPHVNHPIGQAMPGAMPWTNDMQGQYGGAQSGQARGPRPHAHGNPGPKSKGNQKRDHSSAFNKPQSTAPRTPAAPAVPSFGNPLPSKPPPSADTTGNRKTKKRKRKHNQLGLTPNADGQESSEEEEAEGDDEESKLAQGTSDASSLQISYKGKTSTLKTPSEIAAWIAERKKNFPTQARVEAKKKAAEEAKAARDATRQQKIQEQQAKRNEGRKQSENTIKAPVPATDAERREELRRNLEREQKRVAKAVAEADAARLRLEALQREALSLDTEPVKEEPKPDPGEPITEVSQDPVPAPDIKPEPVVKIEPLEVNTDYEPEVSADLEAKQEPESLSEAPEIKTEIPADTQNDTIKLEEAQGSDWTSSGGSASESDSEADSDSDGAPEQESSRRTGPERVPPPPREGKKTICRYFMRNGHCNRGDQCKFSHETSEKGPKAKPEKKKEKERRKGLYQSLLDRQKEDEDHRVMEVISYLGENSLLQGPDTPAPPMN